MDESVYTIAPPCHPSTPLTFFLPVEINFETGKATYPESEIIAVCPTCGKEYAGANKGPSLHMLPMDLDDPLGTFDAVRATFAPRE
jgi:hypothetical protein